MKIWHDDIRPAPEGWAWAQTNGVAKSLLMLNGVTEISLDHDLGDQLEETGLDLVMWMIKQDLVPPRIRIHSWNPYGARKMANLLNDFGHDVEIAPFVSSEYRQDVL